MAQDYYQTLGVGREASTDDIRKAYRRLARKHHPDLNPGDKAAEDRFKKVQEAYDILSDSKKKQMYDQYGFYSENGMPTGASGGARGPNMGFGGFDFSEAYSRGAGARASAASSPNFQDIFHQWFSHGPEEPAEPAQSNDLEYGSSIQFWQAIKGTQVRLNISRQEICTTCNGTGAKSGANTVCPECNGSGSVTQAAGAMRFSLSCPRCNGSGRLRNRCRTCHGDRPASASENVDWRLPAAARPGCRLRGPGKGKAGTHW